MAQTSGERQQESRFAAFAALQHRDFRYVWSASVLTSLARWSMGVAQAWLVHAETGSSALVGVVAMANFAPFLAAPILGGPLSDRFERKRLASFTYSANFLLIGLLAALTLSGMVQVWEVITIAFMAGFMRSIEQPAVQAMLPDVVPKEGLLNAVVLNGMARQGARLGGPAIAGILLPLTGAGGAFAVAAGLSGLAAVSVLRIRAGSHGEAGPWRRMFTDFGQALSFVYRHPGLASLVVLVAFHCGLTMSYEAVLPQFAAQNLDSGSALYSTLIMAVGGGSVVASLYIAALKRDARRGRWLVVTGVLSGLSLVGLGFARQDSVALAMAVLVGASQASFMALANTFVLQAAPASIRGRISSLYYMHAVGMMGFANLANGQVGDHFGATVPLVWEGLAFVVVLALMPQAIRSLRTVMRTGVIPLVGT